MNHKGILSLLEVVSQYCFSLFEKEEGLAVYNYYYDCCDYVIPAMQNGHCLNHDKLFGKVKLVFSRIYSDVYFHKIPTYRIKFPYGSTDVEPLDFEVFASTCCHFYLKLGEYKPTDEERVKLGFGDKILDLLLLPKKDLIFNHEETTNKDSMLMERLYAELKKRNPDILKKYGKSFSQLSRDQFGNYIDKNIERTPQQLINALWYRIKKHH